MSWAGGRRIDFFTGISLDYSSVYIWENCHSAVMFSVKLKVKETPRSNSLPRRRRHPALSPTPSFSSSTSSLSRISEKVPIKSSFLNKSNGKPNKKVRIQTEYEKSNGNHTNYHGRWNGWHTRCHNTNRGAEGEREIFWHGRRESEVERTRTNLNRVEKHINRKCARSDIVRSSNEKLNEFQKCFKLISRAEHYIAGRWISAISSFCELRSQSQAKNSREKVSCLRWWCHTTRFFYSFRIDFTMRRAFAVAVLLLADD